ncbi:hypothetical protein NX059_005514 [Plenodomus lindquistii]|nr:hypothetical protein NX059_005514 [Plenodomus lindquistii]
MALAAMSASPPSLEKDSRPAVPSRSSSLLRGRGLDRPGTLKRVASAGTPKNPLPQRDKSTSTSRHSFSPLDGGSPESTVKECNQSNQVSSSHLTVATNSSEAQSKGRSASCAAAPRKPMHHARIQRWAGLTRTVSDWDVLRRDPELYYADGDCYVHLHARGASQRGPSFCIPFRVLRQKKCSAMLSLCDAQITSSTYPTPRQLSKMPSSLSSPGEETSTIQLFIPAPNDMSREESFRWHITTRNFFALLLAKPLVGEHMGQAFVDLQQRLFLFRPDQENNHQEFLDYLEDQGYRDLVECTDYALASLYYAEHFKLKVVWIDAFAHCVGMNESLVLSPEYAANSRLTKALLTRAHLEVDLRLNRVSTALGKFLQDDLSPTYFGITGTARSHLDYFRQFLHGFYVEKFGYWPPPSGVSFPKALYKSMFYDFQSLYNYLVDTESTSSISMRRPASGGFCVLQNVNSFDRRHGFKAQPHPLPLLPVETSTPKRAESQKALRQFTLAAQHNKTHQLHPASAALAMATNVLDQVAASAKIVQAYMHFERVYATSSSQRHEKISAIDARNVRWVLIYGTLQYLTSALRAPREVRDHESPEYPLCCVAEQSSWHSDSLMSTPLATPLITPSATAGQTSLNDQKSSFAVEPDCNREDYFSSQSSTIAPSRQSSFRSFNPRSLSVRSSRRNSATLKSSQPCANNVHGVGLDPAAPNIVEDNRPVSSVYSQRSSVSILPDGAGPDTSWLRSKSPSVRHSKMPSLTGSIDMARPRTPLLDSFQLDHAASSSTFKVANDAPSRSDSTGSTTSSVWSEHASVTSSKTSADGEMVSPIKTNPVENSGLLGGFVSVANAFSDGPRTNSMTVATKADIPQSHIHPLLRQPSRPSGFEFDFGTPQSGPTSVIFEQRSTASAIGMALSAPPSPPARAFPDLQLSKPPFRAMSMTTETQPYLGSRTIKVDPVMESWSTVPKKSRSSDVLSAIAPPTSEMWAQYKTALTRPESRLNSTESGDATPPPISRAKMTQSFKVPTFRFPSRANSPIDASTKKEKRLSSFWRR